jgi:hypothetical protein
MVFHVSNSLRKPEGVNQRGGCLSPEGIGQLGNQSGKGEASRLVVRGINGCELVNIVAVRRRPVVKAEPLVETVH